jgi:DNA replication protein DnaC
MTQKTKYTHPHLYESTEPDYERKNEALIANALGVKTGWPAAWADRVIAAPPTGEQWLAAARRAQEKINTGGIVLLCGQRGNGKTRLAAEFAIRNGSSRYRTAMRFFLEIRATFSNRDVSELDIIDDLAKTDLLVIDEMQERSESDWENRLLTHLIDARYAENRPTILIANMSKRELASSLNTSVIDRIRGNGVTVEFNWESYRKPQ